MIVILKCIRSNNDNFTEGRRYLFVDGTLTCDNKDLASNVYTTDKNQRESKYPLLKTIEDVNDFFKSIHINLYFIEDTITTDNWFL